jgi:hypothetical protein
MASVTRKTVWIVERVGQRIHPYVEVGIVLGHGLLTHSRKTLKYVLL